MEIPFHARVNHKAAARLFFIVLEAGVLAEHVDLGVAQRLLPAGGKTRHEGIRLAFITIRIGQGLVFLHRGVAVERAAPQTGVVVEPGLAVEVDVAGDVIAAVEIAVIIVVGYLVVIYAAAKRGGELLLVLPDKVRAVVVLAAAVVGHPFALNAAGISGLQIAELGAQLHAAAGDDAGGDGGIVIGRQVQIIRRFHFHAVGADFQRGHEQAAFAVAVERKIGPRGVEHGHAAKHQRGILSHADAGVLVGLDAFGFDIPARIARLAGVEQGVG